MTSEIPLPTFEGGKAPPPVPPLDLSDKSHPDDLQKFLQGKGDPALGLPPPSTTPAYLEKRYEFLRKKCRYEFMTPYDHPEDAMVTPHDMLLAFVEVTSAHGIPHINFARGAIKKICWIILTIAATAGMIYNLAMVSMTYASYPVSVGISIQHANDVQFPAVTLCNMSPVRLSATQGLGLNITHSAKKRKKRATTDTTVDASCCCTCCAVTNATAGLDACSVCGTSNTCAAPSNYQTTAKSTSASTKAGAATTAAPVTKQGTVQATEAATPTPASTRPPPRQDFLDAETLTENLASMSKEEQKNLGYTINDLVLDCQYAGSSCDQKWFTLVQNPIHGNCYTFNSGWNGTKALISHKTGRRFGLDMTINIDQDEYVKDAGDTAGLRLVVHSATVMPFPEDEGVTVSPGHSTSIGLQMVQIFRLGSPYSVCKDSQKKIHDFNTNAYEQEYPGTYYTSEACSRTCYQKNVIDRCGCGDANYPLEGDAFHGRAWPPCSSLNATQDDCRYQVLVEYNNNTLNCECPNICNETLFVTSVSIGQWPSNVQREDVLKSVENKVPFNVWDNVTYKDNLAKIEIYFEEFNYQVISESPGYPTCLAKLAYPRVRGIIVIKLVLLMFYVPQLESYFSDIGGVLGLYLGMSFMSWVEFIELFTDLIIYLIIKYCHCFRSRATAPSDLDPSGGQVPPAVELGPMAAWAGKAAPGTMASIFPAIHEAYKAPQAVRPSRVARRRRGANPRTPRDAPDTIRDILLNM